MKNKPKLIVVCGPTASGKTALALQTAQKYNGELINADSRQVYRGMDVGTNKELDSLLVPELKIQNEKGKMVEPRQVGTTIEGVPIHLVDIVDPDERYTVYDFKRDCEAAIEDIVSRGKLPILVGGTGLWISAITDNYQLSENRVMLRQAQHDNLEEQVAELLRVDPGAEHQIDLKNPRRVVRALQVYRETGIPFTKAQTKGERKYDVMKLAPRVEIDEEYRERLARRVEEHFRIGLLDEVIQLVKKYGWDHEAMTGISYREFREILGEDWRGGDISEDNLQKIKDLITLHNRQYAKRQMTWFKRDQEIRWVESAEEALQLAGDFINTSLER